LQFRALQDGRRFEHAPKLPVSDEETALADAAVERAWEHLPAAVRDRLKERREREGHPINIIRYYPFPVLVDNGQPDALEHLHTWGEAYARILIKITNAYRQHTPAVRRFLHHAVIKHLPVHLQPLIEQYHTQDLLAGAHLGDDFLAGRSVEWNLGAVGGLDEGWQTARQVTREWTPSNEEEKAFHPIEKDPAKVIRQALHWAYESFCLACHSPRNTKEEKPFILFLEHDDLYGSTVSVCVRLSNLGEMTDLAFHHELLFQNGRLFTVRGHAVDLVYMDCHWEDLKPGHPLIRAAQENAVALDCSPFAHLVLRSKVLLGLLWTPAFQQAAGLGPQDVSNIEQHLMPTFLWRRKTFQEPKGVPIQAFHALRNRLGFPDIKGNHNLGPLKTPTHIPATAGLVLKTATGPTYGGAGVATVLAESGQDTRQACRMLQDTIRSRAAQTTALPGSAVLNATRKQLKSVLKQAILQGLSGLEPQGSRFELTEGDAFWKALVPAWKHLMSRSSGKPQVQPEQLMTTAVRIAQEHLGLSLIKLQFELSGLWKPLIKSLGKLCQKDRNQSGAKALMVAIHRLGDLLAHYRFREKAFQESYQRLMDDLRNIANRADTDRFTELAERLLRVVDCFFQQEMGVALPPQARNAMWDVLLEPYLERQQQSVNPILFQPFLPPERLENEEEYLHVSTRTHILFTQHGPHVLVSGSQVFYVEVGKPDNRSKMTASLWRQPDTHNW
jgi:hypothetical protein